MTTDLASDVKQRASTAREFLLERLKNTADVCVTSSFQAEDIVVLHMVREILPDVPVLFLET
ncbi:MAG TPA: hypothetical protein VMV57_07340, partial [Terracidiphilus sp.]|nr:hypothetical protein [Terracidiphilus sp.]